MYCSSGIRDISIVNNNMCSPLFATITHPSKKITTTTDEDVLLHKISQP